MITILGILVSALSLIVVVLLGIQFYNLRQFEKFKKEVRSTIDKSIKESLEDYNHTVSAIVKQLDGINYMGTEKDPNRAFDSFIDAIELLNKGENKEPLEGIVSCLEELMEKQPRLIKTSNNIKNRYIKICKDCSESEKLLNMYDKMIKIQQSNVSGDNIQGENITLNK